MSKSTTWMVSLKKLADRGELGGVMVRLMMALQDFALANHSMGGWQRETNQKLQERKQGAARYFLRLQISHLCEACRIIEDEVDKSDDLKAAIEACDAQTKKSFQAVRDFMASADYKLLLRIRHNVGFHYGKTVVLDSLWRIDKRQTKRRLDKKHVNDHFALTLGREALGQFPI